MYIYFGVTLRSKKTQIDHDSLRSLFFHLNVYGNLLIKKFKEITPVTEPQIAN